MNTEHPSPIVLKEPAYVETVPTQAVITPVINEHIGEIRDTVQGIYRDVNWDNYPLARAIAQDRQAAIPEVMRKFAEDPALLQRVESKLHTLGLRSEMLDYLGCGEEAVVFSMRDVPDVVLKVSIYADVLNPAVLLAPYYRFSVNGNGQPQQHKSAIVSVAFLPRMTNAYDNLEQVGLKPQEIAELKEYQIARLKYLETRRGKEPVKPEYKPAISMQTLDRFLDEQGLKLEDRKAYNIMFHKDFPELPFITDKRAIVQIGKPNAEQTEEHRKLSNLYDEAQAKLRNGWGQGLQAMKHIIALAQQSLAKREESLGRI